MAACKYAVQVHD